MKQIKNPFQITIICLLVILIPINAYGISAKSSIVMEVKTGRILYANNIHEKRPMASTTKIMTALLAIEKGDFNSIVKIPREAVGVEGSSIYLRPEEEISLEDLLYGLMLRSGNDVATAIAYHIGGSVEEFIKLMNSRAKEIGAKNTNFVNPHGLHDKNHYTTAYDLALITREALLNEKFKKIVASRRWRANREGYNYFYNKNKTLNEYNGGDGVKTGYTKAAGRCLVTSATRNGMQVIAIVLNDYNWFNDCYKLMDNAFNNYRPYKVLEQGKPIKAYNIFKGKKNKSYLAPKDDIIIPVCEEEKNKIITVFEDIKSLEAPIKKNTVLGKAKVYIGDKLLATTQLVTIEDIERKKITDYLLDFFS